jgi:hypothetical protein
MAKRGRPFTYQSEDEKPVTVSLRLPRDVYDRVERYVKMHPGMTLTEFFLDRIGKFIFPVPEVPILKDERGG